MIARLSEDSSLQQYDSATGDTLVKIQSSGDDTCFVSANRTCELGMRQATGKVYESFIYALEEATRFEREAGRR
jgi:D-lactate dehydrogenase